MQIWSSYKRKQLNISKATYNSEVNQLLEVHYKYLHSLLVKSDKDEPIFNDTYLKLTYNYNPDKDFIEQYKYYFNLLKGAYYRDDRVANYYLDIVEAFNQPDQIIEDEPEPVQQPRQSLEELKSKIQSYAISQKSYKRAKNKKSK